MTRVSAGVSAASARSRAAELSARWTEYLDHPEHLVALVLRRLFGLLAIFGRHERQNVLDLLRLLERDEVLLIKLGGGFGTAIAAANLGRA